MAAPHETVTYDVHDFKVAALLTDPPGGPATYGQVIDVPGIAEVSMDPNFATAQLKGDARVMARKGRVDAFNIAATYGKLSMDVLKVILGGVIQDSTNAARWELGAANSLPYFAAMFAINDLDTGLGSVHCVLHKAQLTGGRLLGGSSDSFGQPTMSISGQPANDGSFVSIDFHTATTPLPTSLPLAAVSA